jgi:Glucodextranase, domain B
MLPRVLDLRAAASTRTIGALACGLLLMIGVDACGATTTTTTTTTGGEVSVVVTSPTSNSVIAGNSVTVRGTVSPPTASVQVQGKSAAVGNGVFTGAAELHGGKTTIDVIGSAPGQTPGSTSVVVVQQGGGSSGGGSGGASGATPGVAHEQPSTGGTGGGESGCGNQLSVGPDTTCSFAENVRQTYEREGPGTYAVYSPVTQRTYTMTCSSNAPVVCTGGNNASFYFP